MWFIFFEKKSQIPVAHGVGPVGKGNENQSKVGADLSFSTSGARRRDVVNTLLFHLFIYSLRGGKE